MSILKPGSPIDKSRIEIGAETGSDRDRYPPYQISPKLEKATSVQYVDSDSQGWSAFAGQPPRYSTICRILQRFGLDVPLLRLDKTNVSGMSLRYNPQLSI